MALEVSADIANSLPNYQFIPKPDKVHWNKALAQHFCCLMESPSCKESLNTFVNLGIQSNQTSVDAATKFICDTVTETAKLAGMKHRVGSKPRFRGQISHNKKKLKSPKWHDISCHTALASVKKLLLF